MPRVRYVNGKSVLSPSLHPLFLGGGVSFEGGVSDDVIICIVRFDMRICRLSRSTLQRMCDKYGIATPFVAPASIYQVEKLKRISTCFGTNKLRKSYIKPWAYESDAVNM
jgi:hypothetical protein